MSDTTSRPHPLHLIDSGSASGEPPVPARLDAAHACDVLCQRIAGVDGQSALDRYALGVVVGQYLLGDRHAPQGTEPAARGPRKSADEMSRERTR